MERPDFIEWYWTGYDQAPYAIDQSVLYGASLLKSRRLRSQNSFFLNFIYVQAFDNQTDLASISQWS